MKKTIILLFILFSVALISACVYLNMNFDEVEVLHRPEKVSQPDGTTHMYDMPIYSQKTKWAKMAYELCYTLAIAIIVYFCIEYSLNNLEKEKEKKERADNFKQIQELQAGQYTQLQELQDKHYTQTQELQDQHYKKTKELQDQINGNVFEGVLKMQIPEPLFKTVVNDVLNQKAVRQNVNWEYTIEDCGDHYKLIQFITFDFYNMGLFKEAIPLQISLQQTSINKSWFEQFKVVKDGTAIFDENRAQIETKAVYKDNAFMREEMIDLDGTKALEVTHKIVNQYSSKYVMDCHYSNFSILNLKIRVNKPKSCNFKAEGTFSQKLEEIRNEGDIIVYKPINAVLKGQALTFIIEPQVVAPVTI